MKVVGIIQARLGSTRLPGKVFLPLGKMTILEYVYRRIKQVSLIDTVVIATSQNEADNKIEEWCHDHHFCVSRGSESDLLDRFLQCALEYNADYIVRVTSDCPFISYELAETLIRQTVDNGYEYGFIKANDIPIGLKVSIIKVETLKYIHRVANHPFYREHITLYVDENINSFHTIGVDPFLYLHSKNYRLTIDTDVDYEMITKLIELVGYDPLVSTEEIIASLIENPLIASLNNDIQQKKYRVKN